MKGKILPLLLVFVLAGCGQENTAISENTVVDVEKDDVLNKINEIGDVYDGIADETVVDEPTADEPVLDEPVVDEPSGDYAAINEQLNDYFNTNHADAGKNKDTDVLAYVTSMEYVGSEIKVNVLPEFKDLQDFEKDVILGVIQGSAIVFVADLEDPAIPIHFYDNGDYCGGNKDDDVEETEWL